MPSQSPEYCYLIAEGDINAVAARRLLRDILHLEPGAIKTIVKTSRHEARSQLPQLVRAYEPLLVVIDLEHDAICAPALLTNWLGKTGVGERRCVRVAVRAIEAWAIADVEGIASAFSVGRQTIRRCWGAMSGPDELASPKDTLAGQLAVRARRAWIRDGVASQPGRRVGPAYNNFLRHFFAEQWKPEQAASFSPSLRSAIDCLKRFVGHTDCVP